MNIAVSLPGFVDPVGDSQATFRAVLDAMARPGRLYDVGENLTVPMPLDRATGAVLLTLVDNESPLWLDAAAAAARDWLKFHCGATLVNDPHSAEFAVALTLPDFQSLPVGTHEMPESSATLIVQVAALGHGESYRLIGPGLRDPTLLAVSGLPGDFARIWQKNHALYPCGIDIVLCAGTKLAALPRSVSVEEA